MSFCSLIKGRITPRIRMLCFVQINNFIFNLLCVWVSLNIKTKLTNPGWKRKILDNNIYKKRVFIERRILAPHTHTHTHTHTQIIIIDSDLLAPTDFPVSVLIYCTSRALWVPFEGEKGDASVKARSAQASTQKTKMPRTAARTTKNYIVTVC